jgi:hypothetical protein
MRHALSLVIGIALLVPHVSCAQEAAAPAAPAAAGGKPQSAPVKFPFLDIDAKAKQVRVECEALRVEMPLEFFLCASGTNEHESVLRSRVKPSHLHAALLAVGLTPGAPVHFSPAKNEWIPPHGPPIQITCEFENDGKKQAVPAYRLMRDVKTKKEMPPLTWIFAGSREIDGTYAADRTGYLISIVNFDLTVIDIPKLASNANETLEWETNLDLMPDKGAKVTLILEPAGKVEAPATMQAAPAPAAPAAGGAAPKRNGIDQPLVTISETGEVKLDDIPVQGPVATTLVERLQKQLTPTSRVRVAVANPVEQNPMARAVINALSSAGVRFLVIPQAEAGVTPSQRPAAVAGGAPASKGTGIGEMRADDELIRQLRQKWDQAVAPQANAVRNAAQTHYEVIRQLRAEQQRLVDEADKIQRLIDQLEKQYQDMTTPQPGQ